VVLPQKDKEIELKEIVLKGIERFNEIRTPEAKADLAKIKKNEILVCFSGHRCFTCGTYDYFDDLIFEMLEVGPLPERKELKRENENSYLVKYKILKVEK
jgi:hypothetical protein